MVVLSFGYGKEKLPGVTSALLKKCSQPQNVVRIFPFSKMQTINIFLKKVYVENEVYNVIDFQEVYINALDEMLALWELSHLRKKLGNMNLFQFIALSEEEMKKLKILTPDRETLLENLRLYHITPWWMYGTMSQDDKDPQTHLKGNLNMKFGSLVRLLTQLYILQATNVALLREISSHDDKQIAPNLYKELQAIKKDAIELFQLQSTYLEKLKKKYCPTGKDSQALPVEPADWLHPNKQYLPQKKISHAKIIIGSFLIFAIVFAVRRNITVFRHIS